MLTQFLMKSINVPMIVSAVSNVFPPISNYLRETLRWKDNFFQVKSMILGFYLFSMSAVLYCGTAPTLLLSVGVFSVSRKGIISYHVLPHR